MIKNLNSIKRHERTEVSTLAGSEVMLSNGDRFETDYLLWGTGYQTDLKYLGLSKLSEVKNPNELAGRAWSYFLSFDYPHLYFLGIPILDSNSTAPFIYSLISRTLVAHIKGQIEIPKIVITKKINHWDIIKFFASFDHHNYKFGWQLLYALRAIFYARFQNKPLSFL